MANAKQLAVVRQGRAAFVKWRRQNPTVIVDLVDADLAEFDLRGVNLRRADLIGTNLTEADLTAASLAGADLTRSKLGGANLRRADLSQALLCFADLRGADLSDANLRGADLSKADAAGANLTGADLRGARLCDAGLSEADLTDAALHRADVRGATLTAAELSHADFTESQLAGARLDESDLTDANLNRADLSGGSLTTCRFGWTSLGNVDLSGVQGLDSIIHLAPSSLGIDSFLHSREKLPDVFLQGCGVPVEWTAATGSERSLAASTAEAPASPVCFLSFSEPDRPIAEMLRDALARRGVLCWLHGKPQERAGSLLSLFDRDLHLWDKLLLCASSNSLRSWWVNDEISAAMAREQTLADSRRGDSKVLIPLMVDGYIQGGNWKSDLAKQVHDRLTIDFSRCRRDKQRFDQEIEKVISAVRGEANGNDRTRTENRHGRR